MDTTWVEREGLPPLIYYSVQVIGVIFSKKNAKYFIAEDHICTYEGFCSKNCYLNINQLTFERGAKIAGNFF